MCERPRPRTHWDAVLTEMQWLSVDFHEEREWKKAAAKMLAYSAKKYVEESEERKRKSRILLEKKHRNIARFMAEQIDMFWSGIFNTHLHSDKKSDTRTANDKAENKQSSSADILLQGEASSESGVCNLDEETDEEELLESGKLIS